MKLLFLFILLYVVGYSSAENAFCMWSESSRIHGQYKIRLTTANPGRCSASEQL